MSSDRGDRGRHFRWQKAAFESGLIAKLKHRDQAVLFTLFSFMGPSLTAFPSQRLLGSMLGIQPNKVSESLSRLERCGLIEKYWKQHGRRGYRLSEPVFSLSVKEGEAPAQRNTVVPSAGQPRSPQRDTEQPRELQHQTTRGGRSAGRLLPPSQRGKPDPVALKMLKRLGVSRALELACEHSPKEVFVVRKALNEQGELPKNVFAGKMNNDLKNGVGRRLLQEPSVQHHLNRSLLTSFKKHFTELSKYSQLPEDVESTIRKLLDEEHPVYLHPVWGDHILLLSYIDSKLLIDRFVSLARDPTWSTALRNEPTAQRLIEEKQLQGDIDRRFGLGCSDDPRQDTDSQLVGPKPKQQPE